MAKFYELRTQNDGIVDAGTMKVIVTFLRIPNNQTELTEYLNDIDAVYSKNRPFLILYDALRVEKSPKKQVLQQLGDFMNEREDATRHLVLGCAIVIDSSNLLGLALLGLVKSILFLRKPACPLEFFGTMIDAQKFLLAHNPDTRKLTQHK